MKKTFSVRGLGLMGLAWTLSLFAAQAADYPPPTSPFVAPVPENADWILSVKQPAPSAVPAGSTVKPDLRITEVHSTKRGGVKRDIITYGEGTKAERWYIDNLLFWKSAQGSVVTNDLGSLSSAPELASNTPSVPAGFYGMSWLKLAYYDAVVPNGKQACYHYVHNGEEAWVDVESKMPVAYKAGDVLYRFIFNSPPDSLKPPDDFQKAWDDYKEFQNRGKEFQRKLRESKPS